MKYEFRSGIINIVCNLITEKNTFDGFGEYNSGSKSISVNIYQILEWGKGEFAKDDEIFAEIEETTLHELTHFFDYNFFKSWQYKEKDTAEHLAGFVESFHGLIQDIKEQIMAVVREEGLIYDESVQKSK